MEAGSKSEKKPKNHSRKRAGAAGTGECTGSDASGQDSESAEDKAPEAKAGGSGGPRNL